MIKLYQFKFSHFCEKARWALDYKGLSFTERNLLPGLHIRVAKKLAPRTNLPIIVDGQNVVQDSASIIDYLDREYPQHALTPKSPDEESEARGWEEYCAEEIGVSLRLWFYHHTLPDRRRSLGFLLDGAPWRGRLLFPFVFNRVRNVMIDFMNINENTAQKAQDRVLAAMDRLDGVVGERPYLVGERFSRADLSACALLSPFCAIGQSDAELRSALPEPVYAFREAHRERPFFAWVAQMYKNHRRPAGH